jgi:excisionase family DNA binding protein
MKVREVASVTGLSEATVRRMCARRDVKAVKRGRTWRIAGPSVLAILLPGEAA